MTQNIRNFCIIAHIDHGKSTLADCLLVATNAISSRDIKPQVLDDMELERERGITIRSKTVRLDHRTPDGDDYILNLIDTPGHVDFSYEVSRGIIASEGVLMLVDATQGVEAQTLSHCMTARKHGVRIIPIINKIDLATADVERTAGQIRDVLHLDEKPLEISAKEGVGVDDVLEAIVQRIPPPEGSSDAPLKAVVFDSFYDAYRGVVVYLRLIDGCVRPGMKIAFLSSGRTYEVLETGVMRLKMIPAPHGQLSAGEVGYIIAGIKNIQDVNIGDTVFEKDKPVERLDSDWISIKPFVFAGIFPMNPGEYDALKAALEKLHLTDASFVYGPISSTALGPGFHCGFLGSLHLEIIKERIEREFSVTIIVTSPNVRYRVKTKNSKDVVELDNPARFPQDNEIEFVEEPYVKATIISPTEYLSNVVELCKNIRGRVVEINQMDSTMALAIFELPLAEIIVGFYDSLKSVSKGFASFDYEQTGYRQSDLTKLEVLINYEVVDAFAYVVHSNKVDRVGMKIVEKLKATIPRHMFQIPLQARAGGRIVAREDIRSLKKDVLAKCYGGDITRKRKLLEKQREGKKKMKQFGRVDIPQETFLALLKME